jgi:hypothetical protein
MNDKVVLSTERNERRYNVLVRLLAATSEYRAIIVRYNHRVQALREELVRAAQAHHAALADARAFAASVAAEMDAVIALGTDEWKASDAGQAWQAMRDRWEAFDPQDATAPTLDEQDLDALGLGACEEFRGLPTKTADMDVKR